MFVNAILDQEVLAFCENKAKFFSRGTSLVPPAHPARVRLQESTST
jgi:hypothetical protein